MEMINGQIVLVIVPLFDDSHAEAATTGFDDGSRQLAGICLDL